LQWELEQHLEKYHGCRSADLVLVVDETHEEEDQHLEVTQVPVLCYLIGGTVT
jgi:hypothetical protein